MLPFRAATRPVCSSLWAFTSRRLLAPTPCIARGFHASKLWLKLPETSIPRPNVSLGSASHAATQAGIGAVPKAAKIGKPRLISTKGVAYWLLGCGAAVFGIVVLGGLTRLTESGLSITEWRPLTGSIPPLNDEDWAREFELYKQSPEFKRLNPHMTLDEYKFIYYMEWSHRLWGRAIGLLLVIPGLYFVLRGRTSPQTNRRLVGITALLGLQGFIGWWMVHSGIDEVNLAARTDTQPRVSHYRLATHLGAAFLLYFAMTLTGLDILRSHRFIANPIAASNDINILRSPLGTAPRRFAVALLGLAFVTAMSGAFVAGLDAGLLYNTFPHFGDHMLPPSSELFDERYARARSISEPSAWQTIYRNVLDNPVTVQLNHRVLAVTTWTATALFFAYAARRRHVLPPNIYKGAHGVFGFATLQAALGIGTLIYVVPLPLAALHQAGALAFLTSILVLISRVGVPRPQMRKLISLMAEAARDGGKTAATEGKNAISKAAKKSR